MTAVLSILWAEEGERGGGAEAAGCSKWTRTAELWQRFSTCRCGPSLADTAIRGGQWTDRHSQQRKYTTEIYTQSEHVKKTNRRKWKTKIVYVVRLTWIS
jgi:hypothetical protein